MRHLFWRIYLTYLIIVVLCTAGVGFFALRSVGDFHRDQTARELEARAALVRDEVEPLVVAGDEAAVQAAVRRLGEVSETRITVISNGLSGAPVGEVVAESRAAPEELERHSDRPEFKAAAGGQVGRATRESATLGTEMMYVAVPVEDAGRVVAVVRAAMSLSRVDDAVDGLSRSILLTAVLVALVAAVIGWYVSRRIALPMREVREGAERFAAGDFTRKLAVPATEEFAGVAESLNRMAEELDEKLGAITRERNEREAVLESMVEGVLAVDPDLRILTLNTAAAGLLGVDPVEVQGAAIEEAVRNPDLQRVVAAAVSGQGPVEVDLAVHVGGRDQYLQASGALLHAQGGEVVGAVVVLNDVTRLRRLEAVRRDFVANVSHELKTPVTSIKGFAETLVDGAIEDPAAARRFLKIIAGQADRLNSIIEDLLALSSLEEGKGAGMDLQETRLGDVLSVAVDVCAPKAEAKGITLLVECPQGMYVDANPPLLEQAVVNLLDNAVKYSPDGTTVRVTAAPDDGEVVIAVSDEGQGVSREHLPRLFERFYRVDKARSRDLGGTGLGLSIVKHVTQVHGGRVSVDSIVGRGSTFRIHLPRRHPSS
ncbi:MAG: ATP-binding protein [Thermoleophilia bacterium]|jgi:two-component system phosphate regulon sensor histidine kinase PhoR|nr:ATP-binding protein [Thermoleophilia bacterium]